jgi:hypothetical protein
MLCNPCLQSDFTQHKKHFQLYNLSYHKVSFVKAYMDLACSWVSVRLARVFLFRDNILHLRYQNIKNGFIQCTKKFNQIDKL